MSTCMCMYIIVTIHIFTVVSRCIIMLTIATTWLLLAPAQLALGSLQNGNPQPIGFPAKVGQFGEFWATLFCAHPDSFSERSRTFRMTHDRTPIVFRRLTQRFPWRPRFKGVLASFCIPWAWVASGAHFHNEVPKTFEWGFILPYNQRGCKLWSGVNLLVCATTGNGTSNPSEPIFCISWVCWGFRTGHAHAPQERWARSEARGWILSSLRWRPSDFWVVHVFSAPDPDLDSYRLWRSISAVQTKPPEMPFTAEDLSYVSKLGPKSIDRQYFG